MAAYAGVAHARLGVALEIAVKQAVGGVEAARVQLRQQATRASRGHGVSAFDQP